MKGCWENRTGQILTQERIEMETKTDNIISSLKWLVGIRLSSARKRYSKDPISINPKHNLILLCSHKPQAPADDDAFWKRVVLIDFKKDQDAKN